jgi:hypothetical protein
MATQKSDIITNLDATPPVYANAGQHSVPLRASFGTFEAAALLPINEVVLIARLPARGYLVSCKFGFDDFGTTGDFDIGFYASTQNGAAGAALDIDAIAADVDVNAAAVALTEYRYSALDLNTADDPIWDLATLSAAPDYDYIDIAITVPEATTAGGTITWEILYTDAQ